MTARQVVTARGASKGKAEHDAKLAHAYRNVFGGNSNRDDGDMVLANLLKITGFFRPPSYADWMAKTGTPDGFTLHCALQAARAEPITKILDYLDLSDEQMIALEKAAREEARR